jgi:hypothetical protein
VCWEVRVTIQSRHFHAVAALQSGQCLLEATVFPRNASNHRQGYMTSQLGSPHSQLFTALRLCMSFWLHAGLVSLPSTDSWLIFLTADLGLAPNSYE